MLEKSREAHQSKRNSLQNIPSFPEVHSINLTASTSKDKIESRRCYHVETNKCLIELRFLRITRLRNCGERVGDRN